MKVDIPSELFSDRVDDNVSHILIDNYYCAVLSCINNSALCALPIRKLGSAHTEYVVPGWNEIVADKHRDAREAFLAWVELGKPRQGMELVRMQQSRCLLYTSDAADE